MYSYGLLILILNRVCLSGVWGLDVLAGVKTPAKML